MIKEGTVKRTTKTCNLFCNIADNKVEQPLQKSRSESKCPYRGLIQKQQDSKCKIMQDAKKDVLTSNDSKAVQFSMQFLQFAIFLGYIWHPELI